MKYGRILIPFKTKNPSGPEHSTLILKNPLFSKILIPNNKTPQLNFGVSPPYANNKKLFHHHEGSKEIKKVKHFSRGTKQEIKNKREKWKGHTGEKAKAAQSFDLLSFN